MRRYAAEPLVAGIAVKSPDTAASERKALYLSSLAVGLDPS
jgi:hypothetical protein